MSYLVFILYALGAYNFYESLALEVNKQLHDDAKPPAMDFVVLGMAVAWPFLTVIDLFDSNS